MNYLLSYEALPPEIKAQLTRITESWKSTRGRALSACICTALLPSARFSPHPAIWTFWSL